MESIWGVRSRCVFVDSAWKTIGDVQKTIPLILLGFIIPYYDYQNNRAWNHHVLYDIYVYIYIYIYIHIIFLKKHDIIDARIHGITDRIQRYPNDTPTIPQKCDFLSRSQHMPTSSA